MKYLLDASALLAVANNERGADVVMDAAGLAVISSVNYAEAALKLRRTGIPMTVLMQLKAVFPVVPFAAADGFYAGSIAVDRPRRDSGFGLGDRCCLAVAKRLKAVVLTSDKKWAEHDEATKTGVQLLFIR